MNKIIKVFLCFSAIICFVTLLPACTNKPSTASETTKIKINDVSYNSLSEAVQNAKANDTIKIYSDISDNRNIIITKPLSIVGVKNQNNIRPRFYGSFTIDTNGASDSVSISNIDIIHKGTAENSNANNTLIGINIIDGGAEIKANHIALENENLSDDGASGVIISRKINSINTMPLIIKGNSFGNYENNDTLSSAILIKSDDPQNYKNINLNNDLIYQQNSFSFVKNGNQFVSANYEQTPYKLDYLVTSSSKELLEKLLKNQSTQNSTFILKNATDQAPLSTQEIPINNNTHLIIDGNKITNLGGNIFQVKGSVALNSNIENATFEKSSPTASIITKEGVQINNTKIN